MGDSKSCHPASSGMDLLLLSEWRVPRYSRTVYSPNVDPILARAVMPQDADTNRRINANDSDSSSEADCEEHRFASENSSAADTASCSNAADNASSIVRTTIADLALVAECELLRLRRFEDERYGYRLSSSVECESESEGPGFSAYESADSLNCSDRSTLAQLIIVAGFERLQLQEAELNNGKGLSITLREYINSSTDYADSGSEDYATTTEDHNTCTSSTVYSDSDTEVSYETSSRSDDEPDSLDWDADVSDNECDGFDGWDL